MEKTGLRVVTALAGCALLAAACSPALNWRTVQLKDAPLQLLLPCDAQAASRPVTLDSRVVRIAMQGCEAQGATYALSHFSLEQPAQIAQVLDYWQQAVLAQLRPLEDAQSRVTALERKPHVPEGALNLPQSVSMRFEGRSAQGDIVFGQGLWFARMEGLSARLYHAVIYASQPLAPEAEIFFSGLKLQ